MKKYVKPDLFYENFELSQTVASCGVDGMNTNESANQSDGNSCEFNMYVDTLFNSSANNDCTADYSLFEGYCYQTGSAGYSFFHS